MESVYTTKDEQRTISKGIELENVSPNVLLVLKLSTPLMLLFLSSTLMLFCDRLILAHYSLEGMNVVVGATTAALTFQIGAYCVAFIAEVFVGRYNGSRQYHRIGEPIWQMVWFSLVAGALFAFMAAYTGKVMVPKKFGEEGIKYYQWILSFTIFPLFIATFSSFFIGRGKVVLVTIASAMCNLLNIILDLVLIFGYEPLVPSLGIKGSALATIISQAAQALLLMIFFFRPSNKEHFGTLRYNFKPMLFYKCLKIGLPLSLANVAELGAFSYIVHMTSWLSKDYTTVFTVGHSIILLFSFTLEGLSRGVVAIASNLIGAGRHTEVFKLVVSSFRIVGGLMVLLAIPMLIFPEALVNLFIIKGAAEGDWQFLRTEAVDSIKWVWLFIAIEGGVWIFSAILAAGGDVIMTMIMRIVSIWGFCVVPMFVMLFYYEADTDVIWKTLVCYAILNTLLLASRFKKGYWQYQEDDYE